MSAHFLTEQLPDEAIDWDEDQIEKWADEHKWEPLEYHDPKDVIEMIEAAAWHAHEFFKQEVLRLTCNDKKETDKSVGDESGIQQPIVQD